MHSVIDHFSLQTSLIRDRLCAWIQVEGISRDFFDLDTLDVQVRATAFYSIMIF